MLAQLDDIARIFQRCRALAMVQVGNMWCSANRDEADIVTAHANIELRRPAVNGKFTRCCFKCRRDQSTVDFHHHRIVIYAGAGLFEVFPCLGVQHLDAQFFDDAQSSVVYRLETLRAEGRLA